MSLLDGLRYRLRVLLRPGDVGREIDEEARFHLALEAMQREHAGRGALGAAEAAHAARRQYGNLVNHTEERRRMAGLGFFDVLAQDLRFALRSFRRSPGFTAVAIATLAIGIGANTAIFSAVNAMLLRPLPFAEPDRLMKVSLTRAAFGEFPANDDAIWSYPKWVVFRDAQRVFRDAALWTDWPFTIAWAEESERVQGEVVSGRYLATLGVRPALGRDFAAEEDRVPDGPRVAIIGDALWRRAFDASPDAIGRSIRIGSEPYTIIGVLPPGFRGLSGQAEVLRPLMSLPADYLGEAFNHSYYAVARLAPGVTPERARVEVQRLGSVVNDAFLHPERGATKDGAVARPLDETRADPAVRQSLLVLLGAVGLVLLIACANVANLFLVRASARRREIAVRLAVGAGRRRLVRQLLTESLLLSLVGAAASVPIAWFGVRALARLAPAAIAGMQLSGGLGAVNFDGLRMDGAALAFTAALALFTGVVFGLVPALQGTRPALAPALKEEGEAPIRRGAMRFAGRNALVIAETALALVLLAGSGLMLRSLGNLLGTNPGVDVEQVLTMRFARTARVGADSVHGTYERMLERVRALPGVTAAGLSNCPPLGGGCNGTMVTRRDRPPSAPGMDPEVAVHWLSPGFPEAMRLPLVRGRLFDSRDHRDARKAVLVNETAAKKIWPGEDPLGKPVSVGQGGFHDDTALVVGVVGDVRYASMSAPPEASVYLPYSQSPLAGTMLFVRTAGDPVSVAPAVRRIVREIAPDFPIYDMRTMEERAAESLGYARFTTLLLAVFGALALGLATLGIYGVIAFAVAQRTKEIGIRMALGATRGEVLRDVIGRGAVLAAGGVAFGLAGAIATTGVLRSQLYGVAPNDPLVLAAMVGLILLAAVIASWLPARRAATVAPTEALRGG